MGKVRTVPKIGLIVKLAVLLETRLGDPKTRRFTQLLMRHSNILLESLQSRDVEGSCLGLGEDELSLLNNRGLLFGSAIEEVPARCNPCSIPLLPPTLR